MRWSFLERSHFLCTIIYWANTRATCEFFFRFHLRFSPSSERYELFLVVFFRVFTSISLKKIKRKSFIFSELILCNDRFDQQGWCKEHGFRTHTTTLLQSTRAGKRRNPIVSLGKRDYQREWIKRKTLNDWWIIYNGLCVIDGALMTRATKQTRTHAPWLHVHWFVCQIFICV